MPTRPRSTCNPSLDDDALIRAAAGRADTVAIYVRAGATTRGRIHLFRVSIGWDRSYCGRFESSDCSGWGDPWQGQAVPLCGTCRRKAETLLR